MNMEKTMQYHFNICSTKVICTIGIFLLMLMLVQTASAQPELEISFMKIGRLWVGVTANGAKSTSFDPRSGFFPNDYDIFANSGQDGDAFAGAGLRMTATNWYTPDDTLQNVGVYGPTTDWFDNGVVIDPLKNYIRYQYPAQTVNYTKVPLVYPGISDPSKFAGYSFDQMAEVTSQHIFNVNIHRKVLGWSQSYNDDYVIVDMEFENVGGNTNHPSNDTLNDFYINMFEGNRYMFLSSTKLPVLTGADVPVFATSWLHYYGGRVGDTARIFYEYSADNPNLLDF